MYLLKSQVYANKNDPTKESRKELKFSIGVELFQLKPYIGITYTKINQIEILDFVSLYSVSVPTYSVTTFIYVVI